MGRYEDDIPEVFRRAMEEAGWRGADRPPRPQSAHPRRPWWTARWLWIVVVALILLASFRWLVTTYTEWLWFGEVGYRDAWLRQIGAQVISFLVFFIIAAAFLLINWRVARRRALRPATAGVQVLTMPGVGLLITAAALFLAYVMGQAAAGQWESFLRFVYRVPFAMEDPVYARNLGFYVFELPVYRFVHGWFVPLVILAFLGAAALYVVNNLPTLQGRRLQIRTLPAAMRQHLALLLAALALLWAAGYWFNLFDLLYSPDGVVFGAGYTDLRARRPALMIQMALMILLALAVAYMAWRPDPRPLVVAAALWLVAAFAVGAVYPLLLQRYAVEPNELARETPYIEHNIRLTRYGFALDNVQTHPFIPDEKVTAQDLSDNEAALNNIRLWDYRPLQQTYRQLQELRPYYRFADVDIDRYEIDGELQQVMLSAREIFKAGVTNPTWVNQRLEYTHGYGLVMSPVDQFTTQGRPVFYIQDLPPQSVIELPIDTPQLYFGELTTDVVHANSDLEEFDYPSGDENVYTKYAGTGGVALDSWLKRAAFAIRFGDANILLSNYITTDTRTLFHRQIQERARLIAPYLWQDSDPYLVISDGRLVWMIDAYTISNDLPYSQPFTPPSAVGAASAFTDLTVPSGINYVRNAVKITIDAYDGNVNFYVSEPDDPLIQTYERAFPGVFQPFSAMPENLYRHIRYPVDMFLIQTRQFLTYHIQNVQVFYNEEDLWQIPNEIFDGAQQAIEPYYVIFSLPGGDETEFLLIQPYTPNTRNNMIAWIAARNDPPNYGELHVYELPKQELIFGPIQIESRIDQEPAIAQQFTLWSQRGSRVIRGNLLTIPINNSFIYVEPIYLQSENSALPELRRVIVASGEAVVMRETLEGALSALLEAAPPVAEIIPEVPSTEDPEGSEPPTPPETGEQLDAGVEALIVSANEHYVAAETAQRNGDWAVYGREIEALRQDLERLLELTGGQLPGSAPSSEP